MYEKREDKESVIHEDEEVKGDGKVEEKNHPCSRVIPNLQELPHGRRSV